LPGAPNEEDLAGRTDITTLERRRLPLLVYSLTQPPCAWKQRPRC